jgi:hypothetical protein
LKKSGKFFARLLVTIATIVLLCGCLLVARLIIAPLDLQFAKEEIDAQVADLLPGWHVNYGKATLSWDWQAVRPWINIEDIKLIDRRSRLVGSVPSAQVGTSFSTLYGKIQISSVSVQGAKVDIIDLGAFSDDENTGSFSDLFGETGVPHINILKPLTEAFSRFSNRLIKQAPKFSSLKILNTNVTVNRGPEIDAAILSAPSISLERNDDLITASTILDVSLGDVPAKVNVGAELYPEKEELNLTLGFSELVPRDLVGYLQLSDFFTSLDFPFSLEVDLALDTQNGLKQAEFVTQIDKGEIYHPSLFPERGKVEYGTILAHYDAAEQVFILDQIELSLGNPLVNGNGIIYWLDGEAAPGVRLNASLERATIPEVLSYWPIARKPDGTEKGGRAWVSQHMIGGAAQKARFKLDIPPDGKSTLKDQSPYELTFSFDDIDTHFMKTMPPVRGAKGHARLTERDLDIMITEGTLVGMPVRKVTGKLSNLTSRVKSYGDFSFDLDGEIQEILTLINNPPLNVPDKLKLDIERFDGKASVTAKIGTPLYISESSGETVYDVVANLSEFSVNDILDGEGVRNAEAVMHVTPETITAEGKARLNGVWADFTWNEDLIGGRDNPDLQTTIIKASGATDQKGLAALNVAVSDYLDGNIQFTTTLKGRNFAFSDIDFQADTTPAKLMISQLAWSKPPETPATIEGKVRLSENKLHLSPLLLKGEDIEASGEFQWIGDDIKGRFTAEKLGENAFTAELDLPANNITKVGIIASKLDLRPFLNGIDSIDPEVLTDLEPIEAILAASENQKPAEMGQMVDVSIKSAELILLNGEAVENMNFKGRIIANEPYEASVTATMKGSGADLSLNLTPVKDTKNTPTNQRFTMESSDGGAIMRGLGVFPHLKGGDFELDVASIGWESTWRMQGKAKMKNTLLVNKETLGDKVTEGALDGLEDYVGNNGLSLDVVDVPFIFDRGLLDLNGLKANGGSIGMTMEGQLHTQNGKINMNGVIVPAYGLNSLLGRIPLIGTIFSGGEGKGLFGFTYRIKGATDNPNVEVSALSGIAPGFLRGIFEGGKGKVEDVVLPEEKEAQKNEKVSRSNGDSETKSSEENAITKPSEDKTPGVNKPENTPPGNDTSGNDGAK